MSRVKILVEGIADAKFLQDVIEEWYNLSLQIADSKKAGDIIHLGGKDAFDSADKLPKLIQLFDQANFLKIPVLGIFDADRYANNNQLFAGHSQAYGFSYFLLPDNSADGDLETLLQKLIHPENQIIFECWQAYENCLQGKTTSKTNSRQFTTPARKTKIYAYLEALLEASEKDKIKEVKRDYRNQRHWNLNPAHPPLQPLKIFLDQFFNNQ